MAGSREFLRFDLERDELTRADPRLQRTGDPVGRFEQRLQCDVEKRFVGLPGGIGQQIDQLGCRLRCEDDLAGPPVRTGSTIPEASGTGRDPCATTGQRLFGASRPGNNGGMAEINNPFQSDEVVGVAPARSRDEIASALTNAGFDIEVMEGPTDVNRIDVDGAGIAAKIVRFLQFGEERDTLEHFRSRLSMGDDLIRVIDVGDRAEEAGKILVDHGGDTIWHYGRWTYRKLHDG